MAAFNKFNDFVEQLGLAVHNLNTDLCKVALTNSAPVASRISRMGTVWPVGAPMSNGSVEKLYWVFAMHTG